MSLSTDADVAAAEGDLAALRVHADRLADGFVKRRLARHLETVADEVAEDEVIELKQEEAAPIMVGDEAKAEEPAAPAPEAAKYKGVDGIENTRATLVGNASRDPGALVFHRNKDQKYATVYTEMEKFFPGVCPELPRPALLDGTHPGDYGFDPAGSARRTPSSTTRWRPK